ncbi:MAG: erythromycin esterase family protein [Bacteroidetes bacterium]|nr:MAG: erythromycin esterase family protein [Bacteroidota bacterium]
MERYAGQKTKVNEKDVVENIKKSSHVLEHQTDLSPLFDRIGDARIVMLGEASHGTHEFYTWRTFITQKLIVEKEFNFIAVEGDWPDCYRINRYIKNSPDSSNSARDVLHQISRWPTWMWANWEIAALAEWLYKFNSTLSRNTKIGFYGLDVYSLWESMEAIISYLQRVDPKALRKAQDAYQCFEPYRNDEGRSYARESQFVPEICENEVVDLLKEIQQRIPQYDGDYENVFSTEQNALITVNAEKYYRAMVAGGPHSWNVRDRHMADTLDRLLKFHGDDSKVIVWEHNTHIGDARATDMSEEGMYNIGELARLQHHEKGVVLVGFGTYAGTVIAGRSWGAKMTRLKVPEAKRASWEYLLHQCGNQNRLLIMDDFANDLFMENHFGHRAIGVVYNPEYEKYGNYVPSVLPLRYDAFIFLDQTDALHPLHILPDGHLVPGTYPFGE